MSMFVLLGSHNTIKENEEEDAMSKHTAVNIQLEHISKQKLDNQLLDIYTNIIDLIKQKLRISEHEISVRIVYKLDTKVKRNHCDMIEVVCRTYKSQGVDDE